jgi:hypothetical protein
VLLMAAAGLLAAACSSGGGGSSGTGTTAAAAPAKMAVSVAADGTNMKFTVPGSIRPGATEITVTNTSKEPVEFQLIQFDEGHTMAEFQPVLASQDAPVPEWAHARGGVGTAQPGTSGTAVVNLEAGSYTWFSSQTSDEDENSKPQFTRGGQGTFEVSGDATGAALPATEASITAVERGPSDYTFEVTGLKAGSNKVTFRNNGAQLHHVIIGKLKPGATFEQAKAAFTSENGGPPPFEETSFDSTAVVDKAGSVVENLELTSGTYIFVCFMTDHAGGPPHAIGKNMMAEVKVP